MAAFKVNLQLIRPVSIGSLGLSLSLFCVSSLNAPPGASAQTPLTPTVVTSSNYWIPDGPLYDYDTQWRGEGETRLSAPQGLCISIKGELFIADSGNDRVQVWNLDGKPLRSFGSFGQSAIWRNSPSFNRPTAVLAVPNGTVYVADTLNHRIVMVDTAGRAVTVWGGRGTDSGFFDRPRALARDRYGNIWVLDMGNSRVQVFSPFGRFMETWGGFGTDTGKFNLPEGLALNSIDEAHIADTANFRFQVFKTRAVPVTVRGWYGDGPAQFKSPVGVAVLCTGLVAVLDSPDRVEFFNREWQYLGDWRPDKELLKGIESPLFRSITSDNQGRIYLADAWNNLVWRLREVNPHDSTHHHHLTPLPGDGVTFRGQGYPIRGVP